MPRAAEIVVRINPWTGRASYGFASHLPAKKGFRHIESYGCWYGCQMSYAPFRLAMDKARDHAGRINWEKEEADRQASTIRKAG